MFLIHHSSGTFAVQARWAAKSRGRVQRHPDHLLILTGYLQKCGHVLDFIDGPVCDMTKEQILARIKEFRPQLFIFHTTTPSIYNDLDFASEVKKQLPECLTVATGAHASALPLATFQLAGAKYSAALDAIAIGECEFSLAELAKGDTAADKIPGLATYRDNQLLFSPRTAGDIDELAFPAWEFINPNDYRDAGKRFPFLTLINGRGCIGKCIFCRDKKSLSVDRLRLRKPELVTSEILHDLELFPEIQEIMFETDSFTANPDYTTRLCRQILDCGLEKRIVWSCNTRVDMALELLPLMKKAGCRMLMTGFEFGSQQSLDAVKKGITLEQSYRFAKAAVKAGLIIHGCFMIGAPGETEESAQQTIDFAKSLPCDTVQFSGLCPYPGTELYQWAEENGYLVPRDWLEWVDKNYEQCTLLNLPDLPKERIDYYIDRGLREFYLRPQQIFRMIVNIRSFADIRRKFFGLGKFMEYFSAKR